MDSERVWVKRIQKLLYICVLNNILNKALYKNLMHLFI